MKYIFLNICKLPAFDDSDIFMSYSCCKYCRLSSLCNGKVRSNNQPTTSVRYMNWKSNCALDCTLYCMEMQDINVELSLNVSFGYDCTREYRNVIGVMATGGGGVLQKYLGICRPQEYTFSNF